ncbi:cytochrome c oxidase subunit 2 [Paenibacillus mucilaginosus]|uniref:cupredoxin domain-containing protein n=1 Tax=Paenibacillus mucilaginosus TaxID=61624 RepID=UPI003D2520A5
MKKLLTIAAAAGMLLVFSACGAKPAATPEAAPEAAAGSGQQVKLIATNYAFDQKEYKVKAGEEVTFSLQNKQGLHAVAIKDLNVELSNQKKTVTIKPDKPGTYDILCSLPCGPGHAMMTAKLIVE